MDRLTYLAKDKRIAEKYAEDKAQETNDVPVVLEIDFPELGSWSEWEMACDFPINLSQVRRVL